MKASPAYTYSAINKHRCYKVTERTLHRIHTNTIKIDKILTSGKKNIYLIYIYICLNTSVCMLPPKRRNVLHVGRLYSRNDARHVSLREADGCRTQNTYRMAMKKWNKIQFSFFRLFCLCAVTNGETRHMAEGDSPCPIEPYLFIPLESSSSLASPSLIKLCDQGGERHT